MGWTGTDPLVLNERSGDPSALANIGQLYTKEVSSRTELHFIDDAGNVTRITAAGLLNAGELGGSPTFTTVGVGAAVSGAEILSVTGTGTIASAASAVWDAVHVETSTATLSGSTNITTATGFNLVSIEAPALSGTVTVTIGASLYIAGPPTISGGGAITTALALWVDSGNIRADGVILGSNGSASAPTYSFSGDTDTGIFYGSGVLQITESGTSQFAFGGDTLEFRSVGVLAWSSDTTPVGAIDLKVVRDAAAVLAVRNSTTAQTLRIYNTFTDASNYERLSLSGVTGTSVILAAETAGTGADNLNIVLTTAGTGVVTTPTAIVVGTSEATTYAGYQAGFFAAGFSHIVVRDTTNNVEAYLGAGTTSCYLAVGSNHPLEIRTNNATRLTIGADGTAWTIAAATSITFPDACNLVFNATTGTKIGTATNQKLAFYNATPIAQQTGVAVTAAGVHAALVNLGLITA